MLLDSAYKREFPYIYRGVVESNIDPLNLGRCKIRIPFIHGDLNYPADALPWARPIVVSPVKSKRGSVNIPDIGDIVWVFFEGADVKFPLYFGGTYGKGEVAVNNDVVDFYLENEDKISYNRKLRHYDIKIGDINIKVTPEDVTISGDTHIVGDLKVLGDLLVSGTTTLSNLIITGSCNKECNCS